ncbi:MAG: PAS domain S-box protein [Betaproteobacteria bacterium]|nr:PAS domain S-box protein [Betaproteobacteria bacterium]
MPRSAESAATLRAIRWFTITHGITMGGFVILMAVFLGAVHWTQSGKGDTLLEHPLQLAVVGLTVAMLMILLLLGRHARRRLSAELERDRLFTLSPDPLCVLGRDGALIRGNPAFEQFFAPERGAANIIERAHPDDQQQVAQAIASVARPGQVATSFEARFMPATDRGSGVDAWRWLEWSVRRDPQSQTMLYAIARDTTSRRRAEAALAAETAFRQAMEDSLLTGMRAFDLTGRITYVNRAFCDMVGQTESELVGAVPPFSYWPAGDDALQMAQLDRLLKGATPRNGFEVKLQRRNGRVIDAKMYVSPLIDRDGRHTGWMTSVTDITEPLRIRAALAAAHERFTTVLEELDAAVSVVAQPQPDATPDVSLGDAGELLFANRMYMGRWFELRARDIRWVDGRLVQMLVATDITARREADEQLHRQELKLQHNSRLVTMGEMASSLAHELNQPLTAISNYCMGLSARIRGMTAKGHSADPELLLDALQKTSAQAERAGEVIRRIRNFVKRSEPERRICSARDIAAEAVGLVQIEAARQRVRIQTDIGRELPPLHADPILLQQVLINLLKNSIEAMRDLAPGHQRVVTLRVSAVDSAIEFSVSDRGPGIREDLQGRLFEPFFTTKTEGMGIGLNICRSIVESHQGQLWAERPDDGGSRFRFTVPVAEPVRLTQAA